MSRGRSCGNCKDPLTSGGRRLRIDGRVQWWCDDCADDRDERAAGLEREHLHGVHKGDEDMNTPRYESFEGEDGLWWWRQLGGNGEEVARSTEGYSTKEHADRGIDDAIAEAKEVDSQRETKAEEDAGV